MTNRLVKRNPLRLVLLSVLVFCAYVLSLFQFGSGVSARAEKGPADGLHTAEITLVSKDKKDLKFIYLSGILLNTDIKGLSYDKSSNTLTMNHVELGKENTHYSLTVTNMGEDFRLNIVGNNSLDYLSLESIGYDTACTINGNGVLDLGYLDVSSDGQSMTVIVDNTVNVNVDSKKMGYENLPAIKVSSKVPLTEMESMIKVLGSTEEQITYEETPAISSYAYETTTNKLIIKPTRVVRQGPDGKWGYYVNDKLDRTFNGLAGNRYGLWKISNGLVDFDFRGLIQGPNGWYMMTNGKADLSFNGLATNRHGTWFVQDGMVQFNYVGPVVINGQKYSVDKGQVK